jgi:hypothetical protein
MDLTARARPMLRLTRPRREGGQRQGRWPHHWPMGTPSGWLVVQRELTGSVQVRDAPEIWFTAVFSTPSRKIAGGNADSSAVGSLVGAVRQAIRAPARGAPPGPPTVVVATPGLVDQVREVLRAEGIRAGVDEVASPDWAEDVLTEIAGHLAGRVQVAEPPTPADWVLLHQQAAAYARARPWERRADDAHLALELRIGSRRSDAVAIVLGNAGLTRGLALCPSRVVVPEALVSGRKGAPPPAGTVSFSLIKRAEAPREMLERAERYGWPATFDAPLFASMGPDRPQEIGREEATMLTVALAAATEHDRQGAGLGMKVRGQLLLANGRRGRWQALLQPNGPLPVPPGLRLLSGEVRHDLIPEGAVIGLGGLPWQELETVRGKADRHLSSPLEKSRAGDALPVLILGMEHPAGERVAMELEAARPEGIALLEVGPEVLIVIITDSGMHGVADLPALDVSLARWRLRLAATDGWHGIIASTPTGERGDPIYGFFECILAQTPGAGVRPAPGHTRPRRSKGRKSRRGR